MKIQRYRGVEGYDDRTLHLDGYSEKKPIYRGVKLFLIALVSLCVLGALETTLLSRMPLPFLSSASPSLCLIFVLASGYLVGSKEGCVCGLMGGVVTECVTMEPLTGGIMIFPLIYCVLGYISGQLSDRFLGKNLPSFAVYVLIGCVIDLVVVMLLTVHPFRLSSLWAYLTGSALPGMIWTLIFSPVVYGVVKLALKY